MDERDEVFNTNEDERKDEEGRIKEFANQWDE